MVDTQRQVARRLDRVLGSHPAVFPAMVFVVWWLCQSTVALASGQTIAGAMVRFDGGYYLDIATNGYQLLDPTFEAQQNTAFFPGLPWLAAAPVRLNEALGVAMVAFVLAGLAFAGVYAVARELFDTRVARASLITLACWPGSVWVWAFYTESLLIAASSWALWAHRRDRVPLALLLVYVTALSRTTGVVFGCVLALAHVWQHRKVDARALAYVASSAAGLATVMVTQQIQVDDALAFQHSQQAWGRGFSWPWTPLADGLSQIADQLPGLAVESALNALVVVLVLASGVAWTWWARRRPRERSIEVGLWSTVAMLVPQFSLAFGSMIRFATAAWTWFLQCGYLLVRAPRWARVIIWSGLALCSVEFSYRFMTGIWVG